MNKRFAVVLLLMMTMPVLCGCGQKKDSPVESSEDALVIGFSQLGSESAWRRGNTKSMEEAAQRYGVNLMMENANQKQEKQIVAIRSFIAYRADVIVLCPIVESGWDNVLAEARDAGIPVILMDRMIDTADETLYAGYVGADFEREGVRAGEFLLKKIDEMNATHLNIVELMGTEDSTPTSQRAKGFHETIMGESRLTVLESVNGDFVRTKGRECMEMLLEKYPGQIDVLFAHNDSMMLGAVEAIEEAGLIPGKDIIIISVDAEQAAIDLLKEKKINCVVECTPKLGDLAVEMALKIAANEEIERVTHPDEQMFCEFDDLSDIPPRGY